MRGIKNWDEKNRKERRLEHFLLVFRHYFLFAVTSEKIMLLGSALSINLCANQKDCVKLLFFQIGLPPPLWDVSVDAVFWRRVFSGSGEGST